MAARGAWAYDVPPSSLDRFVVSYLVCRWSVSVSTRQFLKFLERAGGGVPATGCTESGVPGGMARSSKAAAKYRVKGDAVEAAKSRPRAKSHEECPTFGVRVGLRLHAHAQPRTYTATAGCASAETDREGQKLG